MWRERLQRRLPRWLAEAVAVPAAAQLACTPVIVALSGQLGLLAVPANVLAVPAQQSRGWFAIDRTLAPLRGDPDFEALLTHP